MSFLFPFLKNITIFASFHVLGMFSRIANKVSSGKISLYDFFTGVCVRVPVRVCLCARVYVHEWVHPSVYACARAGGNLRRVSRCINV